MKVSGAQFSDPNRYASGLGGKIRVVFDCEACGFEGIEQNDIGVKFPRIKDCPACGWRAYQPKFDYGSQFIE